MPVRRDSRGRFAGGGGGGSKGSGSRKSAVSKARGMLKERTRQAQRGLPKGEGLSAERSAAARALNRDRNEINRVRRELGVGRKRRK